MVELELLPLYPGSQELDCSRKGFGATKRVVYPDNCSSRIDSLRSSTVLIFPKLQSTCNLSSSGMDFLSFLYMLFEIYAALPTLYSMVTKLEPVDFSVPILKLILSLFLSLNAVPKIISRAKLVTTREPTSATLCPSWT